MSGTKAGAVKARATIKEKHGENFYHTIGKKGGQAPKTRPGGFATMSPERLKEVSAKGGSISRKPRKSTTTEQSDYSSEISTTVFFSKSAKVRAFLRTVTGRS